MLSTLACAALLTGLGVDYIPVCRETTDQTLPAVCFNGTDFVVSWTDTRDLGTDTSANIYACRVSRSGYVLDPDGIRIAGGREEQMVSRNCQGLSDVFVIWQEGC